MTDTTSLPEATLTQSDFRVGQVLNRTCSVFLRNLLPFSVVAGAAAVPKLLLQLSEPGSLKTHSVTLIVGSVLVFVLWLLLSLLSQAVLLYAAFETIRGRRVSLLESARIGLGRILAVAGTATATIFLAILASLALLIPGIIVVLAMFVATPACVVEKLGPIKAMGRSARLTKGHRWRLLGLLFLTGMCGLILQAGLVAAGLVIGGLTSGGLTLAALMELVANAVWGAFYATMVVVIYHDLRVAKEGVNTDQIAAVFD